MTSTNKLNIAHSTINAGNNFGEKDLGNQEKTEKEKKEKWKKIIGSHWRRLIKGVCSGHGEQI